MRFFTQFTGAALLVLALTAAAIDLDPESEESILAASKQYAAGLMALYQGGAEGTAIENVGIWPQPHYWWEGGAAWGVSDGMRIGYGVIDFETGHDRVQHVHRRRQLYEDAPTGSHSQLRAGQRLHHGLSPQPDGQR